MNNINQISSEIIQASIRIHKALGPGLLENVYQKCLMVEFDKIGLSCAHEEIIPVVYEGHKIETGFRADLIVENKVIIELKSVEKIMPVHKAQTLTYLKLSPYNLALLINFGEPMLKTGVHRFVDGDIPL